MKEKSFNSFILFSALFVHSFLFSQSGWIQQSSGINQPISKIYFKDANTGWSSASGGLFAVTWGFFIRTTNGGQNWSTIINNNTAYYSFHFVNNNTGWLLGSYADDVGKHARKIFKSTDGGLNWDIQFIDSVRGYLRSVHFLNENYGIAVGTTITKGLIFRTTNSGVNWKIDSLSNAGSLNDIYYLYANAGWVVGENNGQILRTLDGGLNWLLQYTSSGISFYDIYFLNPITGWVCGSNGALAKTTDAGNNWFSQNVGANVTVSGIWFVNPDTGYAVCSSGVIYRSVNGGLNWVNDFQNQYPLKSVYFLNSLTGWSAGGYGNPVSIGSIYKTTTGGTLGLKRIENNVPKNFMLLQNFPNPFNPVTTIRFELPKENEVRIVVYDILGREVATLVNEQLSPGVYEVNWDASNFSSGVYYYSVQSSHFTQTKKLVLVK